MNEEKVTIRTISSKRMLTYLDSVTEIPINKNLWSVFVNKGGSIGVLQEMIEVYIACDPRTGALK